MDHGDHEMPMPKCKLNMLWNTQIIDTCIVFRSWHISTKAAFLASCIAIVLLCVFHEWLRVFQKQVDYRIALALQKEIAGSPSGRVSPTHSSESGIEDSGLLSERRLMKNAYTGAAVPLPSRILRASLYGASVFTSFFLMLVFMTYNAYLVASVVIGAAVGHYVFGAMMNTKAVLGQLGEDKGLACH